MAITAVNVGTNGEWQVEVTLVSQDQPGWRSLIKVRCLMKNKGTLTSFNNDGAVMTVDDTAASGAAIAIWSDTIAFNVSAGATDVVVDRNYYVTHKTDGTLTVAIKGTLGATGTTSFGSGGNTTTSLSLPTLATVPGKPGTPAISSITSTSAIATWSDGTNGGIAIDDRRIYYSVNNVAGGTGSVAIVADGYDLMSGLSPKTIYYAWSRTHNTIGWSGFSNVVSFTTLAVPDAPTAPVITNVRQTTFSYSFSDGDNNGASITAREIAYSTTLGGTKTSASGGTSGTVSGLPKDPSTGVQGKDIYVYARTFNSVGWSAWSAATTVKILAGAYVRTGGVWKEAVPYVRTGGVWKLAEPYINKASVWKQTGR